MLELSNYMTKINSLDELLDIILKKVIEVIPEAEYGSILVMNNEGKLEFRAVYGFGKDLLSVTLNPTECYQWRATNGNFSGPLILHDLSELSKDYVAGESYDSLNEANALTTKSAMSAPLLIDGQFFGSINIDSTQTNVFKKQDIKLMEYFANQVTIAIQNHLYYEKILFTSKYDSLTGTINRHHFQEYMESFLGDGQNKKDPCTLVLMDLNDFKTINDQYGHTSGDFILSHFAKAFSSHLTQQDIFARYGGDEFVALFFHSDKAETKQKLKTIYKSITETPVKLPPDNQEVYCQFSYGMAEFPTDGRELKTLIQLADTKMYIHKNKLKTPIL